MESEAPYNFINSNGTIPDLRRPSARVAKVQLLIASVLGGITFLVFCVLRCQFPNIYMARLNYVNKANRKFTPPPLSRTSLFGWIPTLINISDQDVLTNAGLDAYVFLGFFKMAIKLLSTCLMFAVLVISPIRFHFTGRYDQGDDGDDGDANKQDDGFINPENYHTYLWLYVVFSYVFTLIVGYFLQKQTKHVVEIRQSYLGKQNSITDRTIRLSGIPPELRSERLLKEHIESLNIGSVSSVVICREWKPLIVLFKQREQIVDILESYWATVLEATDLSNIRPYVSDSIRLLNTPVDEEAAFHDDIPPNDVSSLINSDDEQTDGPDDSINYSSSALSLITTQHPKRPKIRTRCFGLGGKRVDAIDYYTHQLKVIDAAIIEARERHYPPTPAAFITMDTVATAQMMAQAVLDPNVHYLITRLAPAPHDIIWSNVCLPRKERLFKVYAITIIIGITSIALVFPVLYLTTLLNLKTISKFWPYLGKLLKKHHWAQTLVTGLLPTYLFTLLNFVVPFFYVWLSSKQGFVSHGEEELSTVSKNFFYIFVNLFLVFTFGGTVSNYWGFLSDTTKIAYQLAKALQELSLFYVDLIILQGLGMFPFKLLLVGQLFRFPYFKIKSKTPRHFRNLYKPPFFNFGLQLPQPILILVITIIYSVMSTKILSAGLVYFIIGYYVYKYQLVYATVHPQHSTGGVWALIFRRVVMGLLLFQVTMAGTLALQNAYLLATTLIPLPFFTVAFLWNYQKNYYPLSSFIALRAIQNNDISGGRHTHINRSRTSVNSEASNLQPNSSNTLDERRELNQTYEYPFLVQSLDGPWLDIDGDEVIMASSEGPIRKRHQFHEWEYDDVNPNVLGQSW
ncbi:BA75_04855T0 [Komagataella pastoris]|uniref:BA75_04855T0 n=1 Tax=Komagataella pastoris TaxID=4922 RepID=A0A1B2JGX4_PICPA|nr:BA75_04855T0 [Komagataella pastoris]